jgi:hypothetical protein
MPTLIELLNGNHLTIILSLATGILLTSIITITLFFKKISNDRLRIYSSLIKFSTGALIAGLVPLLINYEISERSIRIREQQHLAAFLRYIVNEDISQRYYISEYFSIVSLSKPIRDRWKMYHELIAPIYTAKKVRQEQLATETAELRTKISKLSKQITLLEDGHAQKDVDARQNNTLAAEREKTISALTEEREFLISKLDEGNKEFTRIATELIKNKESLFSEDDLISALKGFIKEEKFPFFIREAYEARKQRLKDEHIYFWLDCFDPNIHLYSPPAGSNKLYLDQYEAAGPHEAVEGSCGRYKKRLDPGALGWRDLERDPLLDKSSEEQTKDSGTRKLEL